MALFRKIFRYRLYCESGRNKNCVFELILIIILATLFTKFTWRKLFIIVGGVVFICMGVTALLAIFPEWAQHFSVEGIYNIVASKDGYTGTGDLNRLTAIQTINEKFFRTIPEKLFGYGLEIVIMHLWTF